MGLPDDAPHVSLTGAIALGHPVGNEWCRTALAASHGELHRRNGRYALCTMCIGVSQEHAMILGDV
ncbi:hypothetical protein [Escherichia coli]|uniref:hypothetical protein n=1 Tax=Escherichia coli TaxID=562 RepID=UPI0035B5B770